MEIEGDEGEVGGVETEDVVHEGISNDFLLACLFHKAHAVYVVIVLHFPVEVALESSRCLCLIYMEKYIYKMNKDFW